MTAGRPIAGAPLSWGVSDEPNWGHQLVADRVLYEMAKLGMAATELGAAGFLPGDGPAILRLIGGYGLDLVAGFIPVVLHDADRWPTERARVMERITVLADSGSEVLVLAASATAEGDGTTAELTDEQWDHLAATVSEVAAMTDAAGTGLRTTVHPRLGSVIHAPEQIERLLAVSDVALCLDIGHVVLGGGDPLELTRRHTARIGHVHMKDVDTAVSETVRRNEMSYRDAVVAGMYRPLGQGDIDIPGIVDTLETGGYRGWYVLEQDHALDDEPAHGEGPFGDIAASFRFLQTALGA